MATSKKVLAKKYQHEVEDKEHVSYQPQRLIKHWRVEGKSEDEIKAALTDYIESERKKCVESIEYFANTYGFITGPGGAGIIPMVLEPYQKSLLKSFVDDKYVIVVKARQLGVSTSLMFYALWFSIFSSGKRCLIVAHRRESAEEFIVKLKTAYEFLPSWLKPSCTLYSKSEVEFDTKSKIKAITSNANAARSFSATLVLLDEAAFVKECDEVVKAIGPTVAASDGKLIAISTPNGNSPENWFYRTVSTAQSNKSTNNPGETNWKLFELPWTVSSIFTKNPNFRQDQIRIDSGNEEKFKQEYMCCFAVNLFSLFDTKVLAAINYNVPILNKVYGGATYEDTFFVWKKAEQNRKYIIGVDCASNKPTAKDYTSFQVIDQDTYEQCAEYIGKLPTEVFVDILIRAGRHYNNAMLVIEANSYSEMVFYLLEQKRYNNIWYDQIKGTPGFQTNRATRSLLIEKLLLFYNNTANASNLHSSRLQLQMQNFTAGAIYSDGSRKMEAKHGNDDAVLALSLAVVSLTPKEHIHRPQEDSNVIYDASSSLMNGRYSDEYLEYHSHKMGISKDMLESRLILYHKIKSGDYDGTGVEDLDLQHPVEQFEREQAAEELIGNMGGLILDNSYSLAESISLIPTARKFSIDDIFSDEYRALVEMHNNFFSNRNR